MSKRAGKQRLAIDINDKLHRAVKIIAAERYMSVTEWVSQAIEDRIKYEIDLGYLEGKYE